MQTNTQQISEQYQDACRYFISKEWKPCPKCKCRPIIGLYLKDTIPFKKDTFRINAQLTLICGCGTHYCSTMNPNLLDNQWTNHCYVIRSTEKGMVEVKDVIE